MLMDELPSVLAPSFVDEIAALAATIAFLLLIC